MLSETLSVVATLARVFDGMEIPYLVGGSFASSVYGVPRATQDVDIVADIGMSHVHPFVKRLEGRFYVEEEAVRDAVRRRASFNVLYLPLMFKADIFVMKHDAWSRNEMAQAREHVLGADEGQVRIRFASAEDTILHKLLWYDLGGRTSDRQWSDVLGLIRTQEGKLDMRHLQAWAPRLGVEDLLRQALKQI